MYTIFASAKKAFYTLTIPTMRANSLNEVRAIITDVKKNHREYTNWTFTVISPYNNKIVMH